MSSSSSQRPLCRLLLVFAAVLLRFLVGWWATLSPGLFIHTSRCVWRCPSFRPLGVCDCRSFWCSHLVRKRSATARTHSRTHRRIEDTCHGLLNKTDREKRRQFEMGWEEMEEEDRKGGSPNSRFLSLIRSFSPFLLLSLSHCLSEAYKISFNGLSNNAFLPHSGLVMHCLC